jgi:hypothetical protein
LEAAEMREAKRVAPSSNLNQFSDAEILQRAAEIRNRIQGQGSNHSGNSNSTPDYDPYITTPAAPSRTPATNFYNVPSIQRFRSRSNSPPSIINIHSVDNVFVAGSAAPEYLNNNAVDFCPFNPGHNPYTFDHFDQQNSMSQSNPNNGELGFEDVFEDMQGYHPQTSTSTAPSFPQFFGWETLHSDMRKCSLGICCSESNVSQIVTH